MNTKIMITPNFDLREFIYKDIFAELGEQSVMLLDRRMILFAQALRAYIGKPVILNNWHTGGDRSFSGLRPFDSTVGAKFSQHKFGRAIDAQVPGMSGEELRDIVRNEYNRKFKNLITTIEQGTDTWLHADCRYTGKINLYEVPFWN
jgi:hypothetical protein